MAFKSNNIVQEAKDFSKYGKEFQAKILALLLKDRPFAISVIPIMKESYFSDIYFVKIFSAIKNFTEKYPNSTPSLDNLKIVLQDLGEKRVSTYEKILVAIEEMEIGDRNFVETQTHNFCFTKHALQEHDKILNLLKAGEFEKAKLASTEAFKYSGGQTAVVDDLHENYNIIFQDEAMRAPIEMPFNTFNRHTKGGIGIGDLGLIIAPSNFGKSAALQAIARHANVSGKNVVYFSYELASAPIFSRYIAGLIDVPQEDLKEHKDEIDARMKEKGLGLFRVVKDKSQNATVANIRNHIEYFKSTGFFPDLVIIDGLNQLRLVNQFAKDDNAKYEILADELRDCFMELHICGWAAWQTNRLGFGTAINDVKSIGKAIEVFQKADMVITFSQTQEQKQNGDCVAFLLKNRHGPNELALLCHYDPNKGLFLEKHLVNALVLASDEEKKTIGAKVSSLRENLHQGLFDKKKK